MKRKQKIKVPAGTELKGVAKGTRQARTHSLTNVGVGESSAEFSEEEVASGLPFLGSVERSGKDGFNRFHIGKILGEESPDRLLNFRQNPGLVVCLQDANRSC